jgi:hypothetical protein
VVIPKGFPKSVGRVESLLLGFPCSVISMACFGNACRKIVIRSASMAMENQLVVETCTRRFPERRLASVPGKWLRLLREFVNERCGYDCRLFEVVGQ